MTFKKKKNIEKIIKIFFFISLSLFTLPLILKLWNVLVIIDKKNVSILDTYIKFFTTFLGSAISGMVALGMFRLQENSREKERVKYVERCYKNILKEYEDNIKPIKRIKKILEDTPIRDVASDLELTTGKKNENFYALNFFSVVNVEFNFSQYNVYSKELTSERALNLLKNINSMIQINQYILLLVENKIKEVDIIETVLELILSSIKTLLIPEQNVKIAERIDNVVNMIHEIKNSAEFSFSDNLRLNYYLKKLEKLNKSIKIKNSVLYKTLNRLNFRLYHLNTKYENLEIKRIRDEIFLILKTIID